MQDWLKQAQQLGNLHKGLTFGAQAANQFAAGGVNYLASSGSAQTYQASSLVSR